MNANIQKRVIFGYLSCYVHIQLHFLSNLLVQICHNSKALVAEL